MDVDPVDPLSTYDFTYAIYGNTPQQNTSYNPRPDPQEYRSDIRNPNLDNLNNAPKDINGDVNLPNTVVESKNISNGNLNNKNANKRPSKSKIKKEKSSYWCKKIREEGFPFYACAICNVNFPLLRELDKHVNTHKGRPTSYDLRKKSRLRRKMQKKEKEKLKKLQMKIKSELDIEIKPEDGYIGNEKASEYTPNNSVNNNVSNEKVSNENNSKVDAVPKDSEEYNLEKIYKCYACQKQFSLSYYLKLHVRSHTDEKPYTCSICGLSFITASHLGRHNKRIHLAIRHQCRICFKKFSRFEYLKKHFDKQHLDDKLEGEPYDYNIILPYLKELEEELLKEKENDTVDTMEKTEKIDVTKDENVHWVDAGMEVKDRLEKDLSVEQVVSNLDMMMDGVEEPAVEVKIEWLALEEEGGMAVALVKEECGDGVVRDDGGGDNAFDDVKDENCSDEDYFPTNTWTTATIPDLPPSYPRKSDGTLQCDICKKTISSLSYMRIHMRTHTGEKPFKCKICNRRFITSSKMNRHVLTHQAEDDKPDDKDVKSEGEGIDKDEEGDDKGCSDEDYFPTNTWTTATIPDLTPAYPRKSDGTLQCDICKKTISSLSYMRIHMRTHTGEKPFLCRICGRGFITSSKMNRHVLTHQTKDDKPDDKDVKSEGEDVDKDEEGDEKSDEGFSDEDYFPANTWTTATIPDLLPSYSRKPDGSLKCEICEKTISSVTYMRIHMRTHTGEKPFKCRICGRGFITSSKMNRHVLTHQAEDDKDIKTEDTKVKSEVDGDEKSGKRTKRKKNKFTKKTKDGVKQKKPYQKRPYSCDHCKKKFLHKDTLEFHIQTHKGQEKVLKCQFCLEICENEDSLKTHEATHDGPKPYLCTQCGKTYKRRDSMIYHRHTHKPDRLFQCEVCTKSFNAPCKLQRHIMSHRSARYTLRYECPVCAHMFHTKYHVQMHLATHQKEGLILEENRNHILAMVLQNVRKIPKQTDDIMPSIPLPADERSRVCNICGEVFQHFFYLAEHLKSHGNRIAIENMDKEEEKKYICPVCNKGFKLHYYLKLHSFTHTKQKPFRCHQCGKGFITKGKLKRHLETHTGLKKYQCHICYKYFTRPSYLRIHVRTIHGNQDYNFRLAKNYGVGLVDMMMGNQ